MIGKVSVSMQYCVDVEATFLGEGEFNVVTSVDFLIGQGGETDECPFCFDQGMSMARTCHS